LYIKPIDKAPGDGFFYQYIVLETARDASSQRQAGIGNHPEVAAERSTEERHIQDDLLDRIAQATPFPSFDSPYWCATQQNRLAELLLVAEDKTKDSKGHAPYYFHYMLQGFPSQLSSLFHDSRLVLPAFWKVVEKGVLRNITDKLQSSTIRWSGELGHGVLTIGNALYASPIIWEQYPSLKIADLRELQNVNS
jgi:hypothetical protein